MCTRIGECSLMRIAVSNAIVFIDYNTGFRVVKYYASNEIRQCKKKNQTKLKTTDCCGLT